MSAGGGIGRALKYAVGAAFLIPVLVWASLPWPVQYRWSDPATTAVMRYRIEQAERDSVPLELRHEWVPLERISPLVVRAVIAAEDGRFREHGGIDWLALQEELRYRGEAPFSWTDRDDLKAVVDAGRYYAANRAEVRGRSTITQQLAKNLYFTPERSLLRKGAELFVARRLERFLGKDRILELYLNTVELGPGLFGVGAAAREYFDVSAAELTSFHGASLAGTLPQPLTSNPGYRPGRMAYRRDLILRRLQGEEVELPPVPEEIEIVVPEMTGDGAPLEPAADPLQEPDSAVSDPGGEPPPEPAPEPPPGPDPGAPAPDTTAPAL
jgi:monofunctional biosynthetic peptidoglycan transglycosylase